MTNRSTRLLVLSVLWMTATAGIWIKKAPTSTYNEDLARHRKNFKIRRKEASRDAQQEQSQKPMPIASLHPVNEKLDYLLEGRKRANQQASYITGLTIQVYTGSSREDALKVRSLLSQEKLHLQPEINHNKTNYTVRIGNFLDEKEAYPVYTLIKKRYPKAMIRPISLPNTPDIFTNKLMERTNAPAFASPTTEARGQDNQE